MLQLRFADWRANCASSITFVPSCLLLSRIFRVEDQISKMEGVTDNSEGKRQKCHTNTPSHAPIQDSRCTHTDFTGLKAAAFEGGRRGERYSQRSACARACARACACGCECAARHATARLRLVYLMQNILTVVLNGIKE